MTAIRTLAFYLPQFHPIPENDAWWGKGFTEWRHVALARPRFPGHYQPHVPADLGFYDLRVPEIRAGQADLARSYGISGFCYYHYWFHGRRLLDRPVKEILEAGEPDFPFCLCWANESWTRRWDGQENSVLIRQDYSLLDHEQHVRWLAPLFADPRYIHVDNRPLFLVYRSSSLPNPSETVHLWQRLARDMGFDGIYLVSVDSNYPDQDRRTPLSDGFDAVLEFQPTPKYYLSQHSSRPNAALRRLLRKVALVRRLYWALQRGDHVVSYRDYVAHAQSQAREQPSDHVIPCACPGYDNTPRRRAGAFILQGSKPEIFGEWLEDCAQRASSLPPGEQLLFINAWNEWAEGNHLEPDLRFGVSFLEQVRKVTGCHRDLPKS